jgi:hypothetical protein
MLDQFEKVEASRDAMKGIDLRPQHAHAFATAALSLRYDDDHPSPVSASTVLRARRNEDARIDLWTTFNRVQENMTQGGLHGRTATGRRTTTREVHGISENVKLNRALWVLADEMHNLVTA